VSADHKRENARRLAERAGARIYPIGRAWRVVGPTIDVMVADLASLNEADFAPQGAGWRKQRSAGSGRGRRPGVRAGEEVPA